MTMYEQKKPTALMRLSKLKTSYPCLSVVVPGLWWLPTRESGAHGSRSGRIGTRQELNPMVASSPALRRVWQNPEDSVYDNL
ncbi:MAG: hypothetical protein AAF471_05380 [Myxococcota bacterium]